MGRLPAIVLAAGLSSRMGQFKPLMPLGARRLIEHVMDSLRCSGAVEDILVVVGHRGAEVRAAVKDAPAVRCVENPHYAAGEMLSSVQAGVAALSPAARGFILAFADQPAVASMTIAALAGEYFRTYAPLVLPTMQGKRGHPLLISSSLAGEIAAIREPDTLKTVVHRHLTAARMIEVADPAILEDLDTPEDFARAAARFSHADNS